MGKESAYREAAENAGLSWERKGSGHYHIKGGAYLVNVYPNARTPSAYVDGTTRGVKPCSPARAVELAMAIGIEARRKDERSSRDRYRRWKRKQYRGGIVLCYLCGHGVPRRQASVDHVIPLDKGGLDEPKNWRIAHIGCNQRKDAEVIDPRSPIYREET